MTTDEKKKPNRLAAAGLLGLLSAALAACTSTPSRQSVPRPPQDVEITSSEVTRIYVARASQGRGKLRHVLVFENEREIGVIGPDEYLCWERRPGRRLLRLVYEGRVIDSGDVETLVGVDAGPGEVLYYRIDLARKLDDPDVFQEWGKPLATRLSREEGRALIEARTPARLDR